MSEQITPLARSRSTCRSHNSGQIMLETTRSDGKAKGLGRLVCGKCPNLADCIDYFVGSQANGQAEGIVAGLTNYERGQWQAVRLNLSTAKALAKAIRASRTEDLTPQTVHVGNRP
ncbi:WhiB family transcriptional regulator [Candidatus Saccharibacteria bacterium]|nr:WhiB family transcriptional regulator [Candidatus Saccharibacteria bacterium]MCB9821416.1 WhiB family transcriptional regulator [Candidatus Nomurabacteria bacterium]